VQCKRQIWGKLSDFILQKCCDEKPPVNGHSYTGRKRLRSDVMDTSGKFDNCTAFFLFSSYPIISKTSGDVDNFCALLFNILKNLTTADGQHFFTFNQTFESSAIHSFRGKGGKSHIFSLLIKRLNHQPFIHSEVREVSHTFFHF